jgi:hypothetical protein
MGIVGLDIGFRRGFQVPPCQCDRLVAPAAAQRLDHVQMIAAGAVERLEKRIGVTANAHFKEPWTNILFYRG